MWLDGARDLVGAGSEPEIARLPVNEAMIRHWCEALGDSLSTYATVAPPAMLGVWTMRGVDPFPPGDPQKAVTNILEDEGFTGVIATNYEQTYERYLHLGETITAVRHVAAVSDEKKTGVGLGHFVDIVTTFQDEAGEIVGTQLMRILKFKPAVRKPPGQRPRPAVNEDTQFFWEGCTRGELLIQRCASCGVLRHPPRPACGACGSFEWDTVVSSGRGEVYTYAVHHHPPVPGFDVPHVIALIALEEGTRLVANVIGVAPDEITVGMPVQATMVKVDDELSVPAFTPRGSGNGVVLGPSVRARVQDPIDEGAGEVLPALDIPITRTLITAGALASRDFADVHHDVEAARAQGAKDIFMNILTTNGLVARFVTNWSGPDAVLRAIKLKLGAPNFPGDTMRLTGIVTKMNDKDAEIKVRGANSMGDHVVATVEVTTS